MYREHDEEELSPVRTEDDPDWEELTAVEAAEARREVNPVDAENVEHRRVRRIYEELSEEMKVLKFRALTEADKFAGAEKEARGNREEQTNVRCRVRITQSDTLEIAWYRLKTFRLPEGAAVVTGTTFKKNADGKTSTFMMRGEHLKKGKLHKYPLTQFKNDPVWVQRLVEENEEKNEILRKQSEIITEIRRLLCRFDRLTSEYYDDSVHPNFEDMRIPPIEPGAKGGRED